MYSVRLQVVLVAVLLAASPYISIVLAAEMDGMDDTEHATMNNTGADGMDDMDHATMNHTGHGADGTDDMEGGNGTETTKGDMAMTYTAPQEPCVHLFNYPLYLSEYGANNSPGNPSLTSHAGPGSGTWMPMDPEMYHMEADWNSFTGPTPTACFIAVTPCQSDGVYPLYYTSGQAMDKLGGMGSVEKVGVYFKPSGVMETDAAAVECLKDTTSEEPKQASATTPASVVSSGSPRLGNWKTVACALSCASWLALQHA